MSNWSANLKLPYIAAAQAQKHVTHNEAVELLDALTQLTVMGFDTTLPPLTALDGQVWAIGSPAINAWAGRDGNLALWSNGGWVFVEPQAGWQAALGTDVRVFDGTVWGPPLHQNLSGVGIRTNSDANNALAVASPATLFTHQGGGHQVKINKAIATDTASLLFQTGFSGRVELGTAGSDGFEIKTSADGITWASALTASGTTGRVTMGAGLSVTGLAVTGTLTGSAVQSTPTDTGARRLMPVGAFGLGAAELPIATDPNTITHSGLYAVTNSANMPNLGVFTLEHQQRAAGSAVQTASLLGASGRLFIRHFAAGAWTLWRGYNETLGAVSQSGGTATGAILESGSNANGEFTRFADGTQICRQRVTGVAITGTIATGLFRSGALSWTFPAAFVLGSINGAAVSGRVADANGLSVNVPYGARTTSVADVRAYGITSIAAAEVYYAAFGRWF